MVAMQSVSPVCCDEWLTAAFSQLAEKAEVRQGAFVLVVGTVSGEGLAKLLDTVGNGGHAVAVSTSRNQNALLRAKMCRVPNVDFLNADSISLRPKDGSYHSILVCSDGEESFRGMRAQLVNASRLLMPGGTLGVSFPLQDGAPSVGQINCERLQEMFEDMGLEIMCNETVDNRAIVAGRELNL